MRGRVGQQSRCARPDARANERRKQASLRRGFARRWKRALTEQHPQKVEARGGLAWERRHDRLLFQTCCVRATKHRTHTQAETLSRRLRVAPHT